MSKRKPFIIRDFNPSITTHFNSFGVIDSITSFNEEVRESFDDARITVALSPLNREPSGALGKTELIKFKVETEITDKDILRAYRTEVRDVIKRWSEKSRRRGVRGWRASAIKTPTFKRNLKTGEYELRFEVILGSKVNYDKMLNRDADYTSVQAVYDDVASLKKFLDKALDQTVLSFQYKHERFGIGEVV